MVAVEFEGDAARPVPFEIEAQRLILRPVLGQRAAVRQILADLAIVRRRRRGRVATRIGRREKFRIEKRAGDRAVGPGARRIVMRSEEHTSELQSLMRISYAVFCLKKKNQTTTHTKT